MDTPSALTVFSEDQSFEIEFNDSDQLTIGDETHHFSCDWQPGQSLATGQFNGKPFTAQIDREGIAWQITTKGRVSTLLPLPTHVAELQKLMPKKTAPDLSNFLLSPMPGLLIRTSVNVGDSVKAGQELAVVEAMKMENVLFAEQDGLVKAIPVEPGSSLAVDEVIIEFE